MVDKLKTLGKFDNKIFIIVSNHGMTEMPTDLKYAKKFVWIDELGNKNIEIIESPAEMSCKLNLNFDIDSMNPEDGENNRNAELANNNLHIWELVEVLRGLQKKKPGLNYRVLAPKEISELFIDSPVIRWGHPFKIDKMGGEEQQWRGH